MALILVPCRTTWHLDPLALQMLISPPACAKALISLKAMDSKESKPSDPVSTPTAR
jgi:hypothetical protein